MNENVLATASAGSWPIRVVVTDRYGQQTSLQPLVVNVVGAISAHLAFAAGEDGVTVRGGTLRLQVDISAPAGIDRFWIGGRHVFSNSFDGAGATSVSRVVEIQVDWSASVPPTFDLVLSVVDRNGVQVDSGPLVATVVPDTTAPRVSVTLDPDPEPPSFRAGEPVRFTASYDEESDAYGDFQSSDGARPTEWHDLRNGSTFTWTPAAVFQPTLVTLHVWAFDDSNNRGDWSRVVTVTPGDGGALPTARLDCPTSGAAVPTGSSLALHFSASDDRGIARVALPGRRDEPRGDERLAGLRFAEERRLGCFRRGAGSPGPASWHARFLDVGGQAVEVPFEADAVAAIAVDPAAPDWAALESGVAWLAPGATWTVEGSHRLGGLILGEGAMIAPATGMLPRPALELDVAGPVAIGCGASIRYVGAGYPGGSAGQPGSTWSAGGPTSSGGAAAGEGGSHGGRGGGAGGPTASGVFGSLAFPWESGGGGGGGTVAGANGGNGGGAVSIHAARVVLDGLIDASGRIGVDRGAGAGAGGSIRIETASLLGSGALRADGGSSGSLWGAAGGGGRVSVSVDGANGFSLPAGAVSAHPGRWDSHESNAGAGTVFIERRGDGRVGELFLEGNGSIASPTPLAVSHTGWISSWNPVTSTADFIGFSLAFDTVGEWWELRGSGGTPFKGYYRVVAWGTPDGRWSADNRRVVLDTTGLPAPAADDIWRAVHRFDRLTVSSGAAWTRSIRSWRPRRRAPSSFSSVQTADATEPRRPARR